MGVSEKIKHKLFVSLESHRKRAPHPAHCFSFLFLLLSYIGGTMDRAANVLLQNKRQCRFYSFHSRFIGRNRLFAFGSLFV